MRRLRALLFRFRGFFARKRAESDFAAELESHLALDIEDGIRSGLSEQEARRRALIKLGGLEQAKITHRERRGLPLLETLWRDVMYGLRGLRKNPGFAIVSILVIAIGIGANATLFTVVRAVLLKPLPFPNAERLVLLNGTKNETADDRVAAEDFHDWQKGSQSFEQMAMWRWTGFNLSGDKDELPEFVNAGTGSWELFPALGVQPVLGRSFTQEDDQSSANPTVLLTWSFFKRRFGGDASIVGKTIRLYAKPYTVIGVLPKWFSYPDPKIQLWVPASQDTPAVILQSHYSHSFYVVARLKLDVAAERATQELSGIQHQIFLRFHASGPVSEQVIAHPLLNTIVHDVKTPLYVLMAAVGCLLLIACLNLSNLLVARAAARRKEIAIRTALGSSRLRLCREQITESLLICIAGGVFGLSFGAWTTRWLTTHWIEMPRAEAVHLDGAVVAFAVGITFLAGLLAGLLPALSVTGKGILNGLQEGSRAIGGSASKASLRKALLTVEIALTVVLLVCAGLLFKSFLRLRTVDLGCTTKNVLKIQYFLRGSKYGKPEEIIAFHTQLLERVRHLPGVEAAGLTMVVPGDGLYGDTTFVIPEHPPLLSGEYHAAAFRTADPGYFSAIHIPLIQGRFFQENERLGNDKFVIISRQFAHESFPNENPIGKHLHVSWESKEGENYEIVGIVGDTLYSVHAELRPMMYFPILSGNRNNTSEAALVVRSRNDVEALAIPIQKQIAQIDPELPVTRVLTMEQIIGNSTATASFTATLVLVFSGLSLLLAAVGLYGVLAYLVTQRTTEIGIRIALGARKNQVLSLVLLDGLRPAFLGLALGVAASLAATQLIRSVLFGTSPLDATVFVSVIVTLLLSAITACLLPAWRATMVDPMQALRNE